MGLDSMKKRMLWDGGGKPTSDGRNVKGKLLSFRSALGNSYQAEDIEFNDKQYRCLINPDKIKENYDQKEVSVGFEAGMKNGCVFRWIRNDTHWLVYLQRYEEEAYFRAQIRRCDYQLDVNDNKYWIYLRGPVETALIWSQKHGIEPNDLNYSMLFYITKNEETDAFFERFKVIKFDNHNWRVSAVDRYSQDGIIEVYVEEYFDNEMEDLMAKDEPIKQNPAQPYIDGPQFIKPYDENVSFAIVNKAGGSFVVNSSKVKIVNSDETSCVLDVTTGKSAKIEIIYRVEGEDDVVLPVTIKSL